MQVSTLKGAAKYLKNPGMSCHVMRCVWFTAVLMSIGLISLGGGLPSPEYFPFEELDIKVPTPPGFSPEATRESGTLLKTGKHDIRDGTSLYGA